MGTHHLSCGVCRQPIEDTPYGRFAGEPVCHDCGVAVAEDGYPVAR